MKIGILTHYINPLQKVWISLSKTTIGVVHLLKGVIKVNDFINSITFFILL